MFRVAGIEGSQIVEVLVTHDFRRVLVLRTQDKDTRPVSKHGRLIREKFTVVFRKEILWVFDDSMSIGSSVAKVIDRGPL
jgi:hypothetical protein